MPGRTERTHRITQAAIFTHPEIATVGWSTHEIVGFHIVGPEATGPYWRVRVGAGDARVPGGRRAHDASPPDARRGGHGVQHERPRAGDPRRKPRALGAARLDLLECPVDLIKQAALMMRATEPFVLFLGPRGRIHRIGKVPFLPVPSRGGPCHFAFDQYMSRFAAHFQQGAMESPSFGAEPGTNGRRTCRSDSR